jgi:hypothetical protein
MPKRASVEAARRSAQWRALRRDLVAAAVLTAPFLVQMIVMFLPGAAHEEILPR